MDPKHLIVALDYANPDAALRLIEQLQPNECALKIGSELFTCSGPKFVRRLVDQGYRIFLDLKFHDIPNTVARACAAAADLGVWMLTVHAAGGVAMLQAARHALVDYGLHRPYLVAVTVLTSLQLCDLQQVGVQGGLLQQAERLALLAETVGLDGIVCSAHEVAQLKSRGRPNWIAVTPGIRLPQDEAHDQVRVMTPQAALAAGSDFLVIGRPITQADDPHAVIQSLLTT